MVLIGLLLAMLLAAARAKPRPMSCELEGPPPAESAMAETGFGAVFRIYATGLKNMPPHLLPHIGEIALNVEINPSCDLMYIPEAHMGFFRLADGAIYTHHPYQTQQLFIDRESPPIHPPPLQSPPRPPLSPSAPGSPLG